MAATVLRSQCLPTGLRYRSQTLPVTPTTLGLGRSFARVTAHIAPAALSPIIQPSSSTSFLRHTIFAQSYGSSNKPSTSSLKDQVNDAAAEMSEPAEPTGLIATEGIECLTMGTPNGYKASILLEELKEAYGDSFPKITYQKVNIMKNTQKEPWFTAVCPNGRIPAIVDHDRGDFPVFEGLAILHYLTKHYDPGNKLSFDYNTDDYSISEQWMSWQHGGLGPMQGQANHFFRFAKEKISYGIQRYVGESERLYGILNTRLDGRDFVVGPGRGKFSIADISILGWANMAITSGVDLHALFPNVVAWMSRCLARPATKRGFAIPNEFGLANDKVLAKVEQDPEAKKSHEEAAKLLTDSKEKYGYKYASP